MKIGIDARLLSDWGGGASRYLENILPELERIDKENDYYLYSNSDFELSLASPRWHKRIHARSSFVPGTFWLQTDGRSMILKDEPDIFWGPGQAMPLRLPTSVIRLLTVLDLVWHVYPQTMRLYTYSIHRLFCQRWIRDADTLIAISHSTAHDLERFLGVPKSKIHVVHLGVHQRYGPRDSRQAARFIARKFDVSEDYICTVGTIEPRKNLVTLIHALAILRRDFKFDRQLLVAGGRGWKDSEIFRSASRLGLTERHVRFLGFVPEEDMPNLYAGASAFVFPSYYEGFGLPLLEAMASSVPVIASNVSSIPEVVGEAAVLVDPYRPEEFAQAIRRVTHEPGLRNELVKRGLERVRRFGWDVAARRMFEIFNEVSSATTRKRAMA